MSVIEGHAPRAELLSDGVLACLDEVALANSSINCRGCGMGMTTLGDKARHLVIPDGAEPTYGNAVCPRLVLSTEGQRVGDSFLAFYGDHLVRLWVHGLNPDGTPRIWSGSAQHQSDCPFCLAKQREEVET